MRELIELEHWILEVAGKAREEGTANDSQGVKLAAGMIHRTTLVAILKPANTSEREGLSWTGEQEKELDTALDFLFQNRLVENLNLVGNGDSEVSAGHANAEAMNKMSRRIAALEGKLDTKYLHQYRTDKPFGITGLGWAKLREVGELKGEEA